MTKPIIGILGGGQLGMMLCDAAKNIDVETHVFCPEYDCPSKGRSTYFSAGDYNDKKEIIKFSNNVPKLANIIAINPHIIVNILVAFR